MTDKVSRGFQFPYNRRQQMRKIGPPVTIKFEKPLTKEIFDHWINSIFGRINESRFKLWGNPIKLGPMKVQVYGVDKHLWKPIFLELTNKYLIAIVSEEDDENIIHRLVCNVRRYIDRAAKAYIGDTEYEVMVDKFSNRDLEGDRKNVGGKNEKV